MEYSFSFAVTGMDLEIIILSKVSLRKKRTIRITYVWTLNMTQINLCAKRNRHRHREQSCGPQGKSSERGVEWESGTQTNRERASSHIAQGVVFIISHNGKDYD